MKLTSFSCFTHTHTTIHAHHEHMREQHTAHGRQSKTRHVIKIRNIKKKKKTKKILNGDGTLDEWLMTNWLLCVKCSAAITIQ